MTGVVSGCLGGVNKKFLPWQKKSDRPETIAVKSNQWPGAEL